MSGFVNLRALNISHNDLRIIERDAFEDLKSITILDLNQNKILHISADIFGRIMVIKLLDISNNPLTSVDESMFHFFNRITVMRTDRFQFCCITKSVEYCSADINSFHSCDQLLSAIPMRISVYMLGIMGLFANLFVIFSRKTENHARKSSMNSLMIMNLAISDILYSVYLGITGVAYATYAGAYILYDEQWRGSIICHISSFLSVASTEMSTFALLFLAIDRGITIACAINIEILSMWRKILKGNQNLFRNML